MYMFIASHTKHSGWWVALKDGPSIFIYDQHPANSLNS